MQYFAYKTHTVIKGIALVFCLLILCPGTYADNGAVATAVPISAITVDGDLSDWPASLRQYPISYPERGDSPQSLEDLQANFRIGYNQEEQLLYVAVHVQDESIVLAHGKSDWCELFIGNAFWQEGEPRVFRFSQSDDSTRTIAVPQDRYIVTQAATSNPSTCTLHPRSKHQLLHPANPSTTTIFR